MRDFKIGDKVKCVNADETEQLVYGKIYVIEAVWTILVKVSGLNDYWQEARFELLEAAKEKPAQGGLDTANNRQIGGDHYKKLKIDPWDYVYANGLGYFEGTIIKYVSRHKLKGGVEDLEKAKHFLEKLIELESSSPSTSPDDEPKKPEFGHVVQSALNPMYR